MAGPRDDRIDDLRARLEAISEELADLSLEILQEAADEGATAAPEREKRITRARRAVDKAAALL